MFVCHSRVLLLMNFADVAGAHPRHHQIQDGGSGYCGAGSDIFLGAVAAMGIPRAFAASEGLHGLLARKQAVPTAKEAAVRRLDRP